MRTIAFGTGKTEMRVGKLLCLGRNYADHAREMRNEVPAKPIVFLKPSTAIIRSGENVILPPLSKDVHHEVELVVLIGKEGKAIPKFRAFEHVGGYAVGLDMAMRDVQEEAKSKGLPWTVAKGFDTSAPISDIVEKDRIADPHDLFLTLKVNGVVRQHANTSSMLFRVDDVIAFLSDIFTLEEGDLIFTGTPEGVGRVQRGDILEAQLGSFATLRVGVA